MVSSGKYGASPPYTGILHSNPFRATRLVRCADACVLMYDSKGGLTPDDLGDPAGKSVSAHVTSRAHIATDRQPPSWFTLFEGFTPVGGVHPGWWGSPRLVGFRPCGEGALCERGQARRTCHGPFASSPLIRSRAVATPDTCPQGVHLVGVPVVLAPNMKVHRHYSHVYWSQLTPKQHCRASIRPTARLVCG